ncbi:hypothetical protein B0H34DRAFT_676616 [Crassisporium funariophilum]|nr:hypothetical protein B0H34DRAFT_676616 [Crassisporium funariophilum]
MIVNQSRFLPDVLHSEPPASSSYGIRQQENVPVPREILGNMSDVCEELENYEYQQLQSLTGDPVMGAGKGLKESESAGPSGTRTELYIGKLRGTIGWNDAKDGCRYVTLAERFFRLGDSILFFQNYPYSRSSSLPLASVFTPTLRTWKDDVTSLTNRHNQKVLTTQDRRARFLRYLKDHVILFYSMVLDSGAFVAPERSP